MTRQLIDRSGEALFLDWRSTLNIMRRYAIATSPEPAMYYAETAIESSRIPLDLEFGSENDSIFEGHKPCFSSAVRDNLTDLGLSCRDVDILVPHKALRCQRKGVTCSVFGRFRPEQSFVRITEHLFILTPEAVFYRMHFNPYLSFPQRVFLGMELCGSFTPVGSKMRNQVFASIQEYRTVLDTSPIHVPSTVERAEITSTQEILGYLRNMDALRRGSGRGPRHLVSAYRTLECLADHSASPMESLIMCMCCLPCEEGGCGFAPAQFNAAINLDERSRLISGKKNVYVDICWPSFGLEYDSDEWHSGISELRGDATRRLTLASGAFTLVTVTRDQITSNKTAELLLLRIAQNLGEPAPSQSFDAVEMRRDLRELLLSDCTEW